MKISFFPIDIDLLVEDTASCILLFGRDEQGERLCIKYPFEPYLRVRLSTDHTASATKESLLAKLQEHATTLGFLRVDDEERILNGNRQKVHKIIVKTPDTIPQIRDLLNKLSIEFFEADILYVGRFLIDKEISCFKEYLVEGEETAPLARSRCILASTMEAGEKSYDERLKILALDIETYPDERKGTDNAILMAAFAGTATVDKKGNEETGKQEEHLFRRVITWKTVSPELDYVERVQGESELIERMKEIINDYDPDLIVGYSSDLFDFPFIAARAQKYKLKLDLGIDRSQLGFGRGRFSEARIKGIPHLDLYTLHKNILSQSLKTESLKLDEVAKELLGEGKKELNGHNILDLAPAWDHNDTSLLSSFCEYNLQDAEITYKLAAKLLPGLSEMVKIIGLPLFEVARFPMSQMVEWFLIKNASKEKILIPNKPSHDEIHNRSLRMLQGASVFEPTPGLYHDILLFDFRSLYPTIIASHNLAGESRQCSCCRLTGKRVPLEGPELWFCQKRKAFLPRMIEELITRRMRVKEIMKEQKTPFLEARQQALKLLANSFYGYLAFDISRWYSFEAANSTTAYARHYIKSSIQQMQDAGFKVIYSDTDSIFITLASENTGEQKHLTKEDALTVMRTINKQLPGLMELEFEGHYPTGIFVAAKEGKGGAKKRYALLDDHDRLTIKGFESIRRNTAAIAKIAQKKVLNIILKEQNPEKARSYILELLEKIKKHQLELVQFVIKTRLSRDLGAYESIGPHVQIAKKMQEAGVVIGPGSVISYVVCYGEGPIRDRAKLIEDARREEIDAEYYIHNQILPAVEKIFEALGHALREELESKERSTLKELF